MSNNKCRDEVMVYGLKPLTRSDYIPEYIKYDELFSPPECQSIIEFGKSSNRFNMAAIGSSEPGGFAVDPKYRMVKTATITPEDDFDWLYLRVLQRIVWTNNQRFRFDISGLNETMQLLWYQNKDDTPEAIPGHYNWHQDIGLGDMSLRKLSVVIQLSKPEDYDGCALTLQTHQLLTVPERKQGDMIIFPSYIPHMVTPITRGNRFAIVLWVSGPPWR